ncbi:MAG: amidohydrolase, partial [Calditrichia bacterium]
MVKMKLSKLDSLITRLYPDLQNLRRDLHRDPELSWKEYRTTNKIRDFLRQQGYSDFHQPLDTGLVTETQWESGRPAIALRADIDALPIADAKTTPYASQNAGVSHACGHDVHTAVMCGVAAVLQQLGGEMGINARFLFQPAEEPIPSGAPQFIKKGVLDGIDHILGMHVEPELKLGQVSVTEGWVNAQSIRLEWQFLGEGGHSARPQQTANPIDAASMLMSRMQSLA